MTKGSSGSTFRYIFPTKRNSNFDEVLRSCYLSLKLQNINKFSCNCTFRFQGFYLLEKHDHERDLKKKKKTNRMLNICTWLWHGRMLVIKFFIFFYWDWPWCSNEEKSLKNKLFQFDSFYCSNNSQRLFKIHQACTNAERNQDIWGKILLLYLNSIHSFKSMHLI